MRSVDQEAALKRFNDREVEWGKRLFDKSLAMEASVPHDDSLRALRTLSKSYDRNRGFPERQELLLKRYSATVVCGLAAVGNLYYDGDFWPGVSQVLGTALTAADQRAFGQAFKFGLKNYRLSKFETPQTFVGEIMMHAGVPVASIKDLLITLANRDASRPGNRGVDICEWAGSLTRVEASIGKKFDAPTWRFLSFGREVAIDFVDRLLEVLDSIESTNGALDAALEKLPLATSDEIRRLLESGELNRNVVRKRHRKSGASPRITIGPGVIEMRLPVVEALQGSWIRWRFIHDGVSSVHEMEPWFPGDRVRDDRFQLGRPVKSVEAVVDDTPFSWKLEGFDTSSGLMVFDAHSSELVSTRSYLPKDRVYICVPNPEHQDPAKLIEFEPQPEISPILGERESPEGWEGWSVFEARLNGITRLRAIGCDRWRFVSTIARPTLIETKTIPCIKTETGERIFSAPPRVVLPPTEQFDGANRSRGWVVNVFDREGQRISGAIATVGLDPVEVDPWQEATRPLLGSYEIRIGLDSGALGKRWSFQVNVIERCWANADPPYRWFDERGNLGPVRVLLTIEGKHHRVGIPGASQNASYQLQHGDSVLPILVEVEHMSMRLQTRDARSNVLLSAANVEIEDASSTTLQLSLPSEQRASVELSNNEGLLQREPVVANAFGSARIALEKFSGCFSTTDAQTLELVIPGHVARLITLRPRKVVNSWIFEEGVLKIERASPNLDLELIAWLDSAPWKTPVKIRLEPGASEIQLPESLLGRGDVSIQARIFDPWNGEETERSSENQMRISGLIASEAQSTEEHFIRFIAGVSQLPDTPEALEFGIEHYQSFSKLQPQAAEDVLSAVAAISEEHPRDIVDFTHGKSWNRASHTRFMVESSVFLAQARKKPVRSATWEASPFLGMLESMDRWKDPLLKDQVDLILGESGWEIFDGGRDCFSRAGSFGPNIGRLAEMPEDTRKRVVRALRVIPGRFLDEGQRVSHAMGLFEQRENPLLESTIRRSRMILDEVRHLMYTQGLPLTPIDALVTVPEWQALPPTALALAFLGRMSARGLPDANSLLKHNRRCLVDLAMCAPEYVEQCLVVSELWLKHWERKK